MSHDASINKESDYGTGLKTLYYYTLGIVLCVILTIIPFGAVVYSKLFDGYNFLIIFTCAVFQFFIQVICFLRLNYSTPQSKINVLSFIFTGFLLLLVLFGSLWIMWNLNYNMMH